MPTNDENILIISTGMEVILANKANIPISTRVATPDEAANFVFKTISFFITFFVNNGEFLLVAAKVMLNQSKHFFLVKFLI
ncbi:MAG: hypothetical protein P1U56_17790 [Saprospiraceae bacterium]|nr:hypothetical protein [Saprospiraceae bacterium]